VDQVKLVLDFLKKHNFWFVCGILSIVVLIFSIVAARKLSDDRNKNISAIKSALSSVQNVLNTKAEIPEESVTAHPNEQTVRGMEAEIDTAEKVAIEAWVKRRQSQNPLYKWPDVLGEHRKRFEQLPAPELIPLPAFITMGEKGSKKSKDPSAAAEDPIPEIDAQILEKYGNEIHKVVPGIAAIIGANWNFDPSKKKAKEDQGQGDQGQDLLGGLGRSIRGNVQGNKKQGVEVKTDVVLWNNQDQTRWNELVTVFNSEAKENRPNMVQAAYIQENLWLLETLFRMIKEVNGEADSNDNAAIKKIDHVFFGQDAQGLSGELTPVDNRLAVQAVKFRRTDLKPPATPPKPPASDKPSTSQMRALYDPADRRFVDANFNPIAADTVRAAVKAQALSDNAPLTVAKRVPFRVAFVMDERKIPAFLAACANSPFRFETRQVRVNRHVPGQSGGSSSTSGGGGQSDQGGELGAGMASGDRSGGAGFGRASSGRSNAAIRTNYDVKVEFYGFIKIYNPVNYNLFDAEQPAADAAPADSATPAVTATH
jgi:hypothetical protein